MPILDEIRANIKPQIDLNEKRLKEAETAIRRFEEVGIDTAGLRLKLQNAKRRLEKAKAI